MLLLVLPVQPSTAARYASKALAAHVGMLQSESLVVQYQRQFVEAELQRLQATTSSLRQQQHQLQQQQQQQEEEERPDVQHRQQQPTRVHQSTRSTHLPAIPATVSFQGSLQQHVHVSESSHMLLENSRCLCTRHNHLRLLSAKISMC
jgi:hypothetical protein